MLTADNITRHMHWGSTMKTTVTVPLLACLVAAGCTSTYQQKPTVASQASLNPGKQVAVATPQNGSYGAETYGSSGASTAAAVRAAFARHTSQVVVAPDCRDLACLRGRYPDATYYVVPMILHWEDRATEWSGKKDKIEVKLSVYGVDGEQEIAGTLIGGKSKWATFGGDHPQDLLPEPIQAYVDTLY